MAIAVSNSNKKSVDISETSMIKELTKGFDISKSELLSLKKKEGSYDKVYYKLICQEKQKIKTDELVYDLYDKGYSLKDIDIACEYSALSGLDPEKILKAKGKAERYKLVKSKDKDGKEIETVIDNNDKIWNAAVQKLGINFKKYNTMLGLASNKVTKMENEGISNRQAYDMFMVSRCYDIDVDSVVDEVKKGKKLSEIDQKHLKEWKKKQPKQVLQEKNIQANVSAVEDSQASMDEVLIKAYKITDEEIKLFKANGIEQMSQIAYAKHLAAANKTTVDRVLEIKNGNRSWEDVKEYLGGEK